MFRNFDFPDDLLTRYGMDTEISTIYDWVTE